MVAGMIAALLTLAPQVVIPRVDCGVAPSAEATARCLDIVTAMDTAVRAEGLVRGASELCGGRTDCFELVARTQGAPVYFELRSHHGVRLIAHTDVSDYRATHQTEDLLVGMGFLTFLAAPLAMDLHTPTSRADEERAWRIMARRVLHQGIKKEQRFVGANEVRGRRWTAVLSTPQVSRVIHPEADTVISDKDYQPIAADSDEGREAHYGASLAVAALVNVLDEESDFQCGDCKQLLVAILDANGRFRSFLFRNNPAVFRNRQILPILKRSAFTAQGVPMPGFTKIEIPLQLIPSKRK